MIPLFEVAGKSTCPMGMPMSQNRLAVPTWSYAMEVLPPARIVELGTMNGGFTIALGLHAFHIGAKVTSYERSMAPSEHFAALGKFLGINFRDQVDIWACEAEIAALIAQPGITYMLCDGGDKPRELATFAKYLKLGDVIASHDYCCAPGSEFWPWGEITAAQGAAVADAHTLEPWLQNHFDMAGWLVYRKRK